jgi:hypothetical protein
MGTFGDLLDRLAFWRDEPEDFTVEGCFTLPDDGDPSTDPAADAPIPATASDAAVAPDTSDGTAASCEPPDRA